MTETIQSELDSVSVQPKQQSPPDENKPHNAEDNDNISVMSSEASAYRNEDRLTAGLSKLSVDTPSFSPFPKVSGSGIPLADEEKEEILWNSRRNVLHSQEIDAQLAWARDVLTWVELCMEAAERDPSGKGRPSTPRVEHELRIDAMGIVNHLAEQSHPEALYIRSKWLEFGKFGQRVDKREAYNGYRQAADLGHARSEYRMGMLFEQSNDITRAKEHYYKGISLKDSAALYRMGMMSLLGQHGEIRDFRAGLERIRAAADTADDDAPQGAFVYGMLIARDLPDIDMPEGLLTNNVESARSYIDKAAYLGFAKAQLKMGQAYELCQLGCEFSPAYSLHYYGLAAKQGVPEAAMGVSRWFLFGFEGSFKKNEELAFKFAREAAAQQLPSGEFAVGYYYEIGIHVSKNLSEARTWYQRAAEHGNADAPGRLESLKQDKTLSKSDHETITLTRIKSQHGSQRGDRPERFRNRQTSAESKSSLPTLSEQPTEPTTGISPRRSPSLQPTTGISPSRSPNLQPTTGPSPNRSPNRSPNLQPLPQGAEFPDPSKSGVSDRQPAFNIRLDSNPHPTARPPTVTPYPDDDRPGPLNVSRPKSTAPYPDDDEPPAAKRPVQQAQHLDTRPPFGPQADRPMSAFGIRTDGLGPAPASPHTPISAGGRLPHSQSVGNIHQQPLPPQGGRGRVVSAGIIPAGQRPPVAGQYEGRPMSAAPYPNASNQPPYMHGANRPINYDNRTQGLPPNPAYGPRTSSRPASASPALQHTNNPALARVPVGGPAPRFDRISSMPVNPRPATSSPFAQAGGRTQPPMPNQAAAGRLPTGPVPPKDGKGQGPATFEDMGIPQGKNEGDCVSIL